jgi:crotonobetainyl-CoA:carnitine CoA-transferase CaiB-like acyl-CoA transferase
VAATNLEGIRILDLTDEPGFLAGRVLGDLGADVIKVEPPEGHPFRRRGPFRGGIEDAERSLGWLALNTSKRGVTLRLEHSRGRDLFLQLCETADAVLETGAPGALDGLGLGYDVLSARNPRLVLVSITPFGQDGPRREWRASDLTVVATGGNLFCTGDPDRAPVRCTLPTSYFHAGLEAAIATVFALLGREVTGRGQHVDVSLQEVMLMPNMSTPAHYAVTGFVGTRMGPGYRVGTMFQPEIWPCRDGFVSFALRGGPARIPGLVAMVAWMDEHGMAPPSLTERDWKAYNHNLLTQEEVDEMAAAFRAFFATKTKAELYAAALERKLMLAPINGPADVLASAQLASREFFVDVEDPEGTLRHPGRVARLRPEGLRDPFRAPRLGEHNDAVLAELGLGPEAVAALRTEGIL